MVVRCFLCVFASVLAAMAVLTGCGGSDEKTGAGNAQGTGAPAGPVLGGGRSAEGGALGRFDVNGDGVIEASEVPEMSRARVMSADADGDGKVTADEMAQGQGRMRQEGGSRMGAGRPDAAELIGRFDQNGDGKLTTDELPETMRARFTRADANGDGVVTKEELEQGQGRMRGQAAGEGAVQ